MAMAAVRTVAGQPVLARVGGMGAEQDAVLEAMAGERDRGEQMGIIGHDLSLWLRATTCYSQSTDISQMTFNS